MKSDYLSGTTLLQASFTSLGHRWPHLVHEQNRIPEGYGEHGQMKEKSQYCPELLAWSCAVPGPLSHGSCRPDLCSEHA